MDHLAVVDDLDEDGIGGLDAFLVETRRTKRYVERLPLARRQRSIDLGAISVHVAIVDPARIDAAAFDTRILIFGYSKTVVNLQFIAAQQVHARVVPSKKTEPISSGKAEPLWSAGVDLIAWRARLPSSARGAKRGVRVGQKSWLDAVWRGVAGGSVRAAEPCARERDHRQRVRLGWPEAVPGWLACTGKAPPLELPAERDQGLGTWIRQRNDRPLEQPAGEADRSRVGWTSGVTHDTWLGGRGMTLPAAPAPSGVKRWVGLAVCLSCDSCLL